MTAAQALPADRFARRPVEPAPALRAAPRPPRAARRGRPSRATKELWIVAGLALAVHAAVAWQLAHRPPAAQHQAHLQDIELLRPAPPPEAPPPPAAPAPAPQPARVRAAPPPAVRTAAADASPAPPQAVTIPENLTAPPTPALVAAAPPAPPAPPPAPRVEEPLVEPSATAAYLNNPAPVYPKAAQRLGLQGRVLLRVQVLASGQPGQLEIKESSGQPLLDEAALKAVRGWSFVPARRGSRAVDGWTTVPIEFRLG